MAIYAPRPDIKSKLDRIGMPRTEIARATGISYATIASYDARRVRASGVKANALAKLYAKATGINDLDAARDELFEFVAEKKLSTEDRPRDEQGRLLPKATIVNDDH